MNKSDCLTEDDMRQLLDGIAEQLFQKFVEIEIG